MSPGESSNLTQWGLSKTTRYMYQWNRIEGLETNLNAMSTDFL